MSRSINTMKTVAISRGFAVLVLAAAAMGIATDRTSGDELCSNASGNVVTDKATGSVLAAGATVVGVMFHRDGTTFRTDPTICVVSAPAGSPLPDCDNDGVVGPKDYACLYDCMLGPDSAVSEACEPFDSDLSGTVDLEDIQNFLNRFGEGVGL